MSAERWTERSIANAVARQMFNGRSTLVVPNCTWTGHEADLLCVDVKSLKVIDVEVKISRADLKADAKKAKWWQHSWSYATRRYRAQPVKPLDWPQRVWKHYYVMPADIYAPELLATLPACSGVMLIARTRYARTELRLVRRAKPNPAAKPITPTEAINIARLASLRMWDAIKDKQ